MDKNNAGELKISLLVEGMDIEEKSKEGVGKDWQEKIYSYSLSDWTEKKLVLPSDIKVDNRVYIGVRYNPTSRWKLKKDNGFLKVENTNKESISVELIPRPDYYDSRISDGKKLQEIGVACGNHGFSFFINSFCEYFMNDENCRFCGLVPTQKKFSDTVKKKKLYQVSEVTAEILDSREKIDFIQLSGGSKYNHDVEVRNYISFIKNINKQLKKRGLEGMIPIHMTSMPPRNLNILNELKDAGLDTLSFDMECPSEEYFKKYCPGKEKSYGYKNMRDSLKKAQEVFGEGNVYSIVLMGIEPRKEFIKSLENIMADGVVPTLNVFHYDPFCSSNMDKEPHTEDIILTTKDVSKLFRKYNAFPGRLGCAHYDIGHEIKKGYF
ncbi:MAG: radical SAM protein [Nanoarchaeota archaeon]